MNDAAERAARALENAIAAKSSAALRMELGLFATIVTAAQIRGGRGLALQIITLLAGIRPATRVYLEHGHQLGLQLGYHQAGKGRPTEPVPDPDLERLIGQADERLAERLAEASKLAQVLPMETPDDLMVVIAKARSALLLAEQNAGWTVHRSVALGHAEVAKATGLNLVWLAERNACPACLAYQGHVVSPGRAFPPGLTYGDTPVKPYGKLIAPPLHPHCRCQLQTTHLEAGSLDPDLAREAARSIARGLSDYQSEIGRQRAADRLLKGTTGLPPVRLPKSVLERTARNLAEKRFKARPGSPAAKLEIAQRARDRARARSRKV